MKTIYRKVTYTYDYKDHGRWVTGMNETSTIKEIKEIAAIVGAKTYRIKKRITTIKERVVE